MRCPVGAHETVGAEILLVYPAVATEVATVEEVFASVRVGRLESLVYPVPDETTLQLGRFEDDVPIFLEVTGTVAHGVRVLAKDPRPVRVGPVGVLL